MTPAAPAAGSLASAVHAAREVARDIKLAHSVFALPFALLGAVYAATLDGAAVDWQRLGVDLALVVGCMVCARTAAMVANRVLDHQLDARNPRTAGRAIPAGRLSVRAAVVAWVLAGGAFVALTALFGVLHGNWWPLMLSVPVLAWICVYGLFKRFSAACHIWLGASLAMSPVAAALAVQPAAVATDFPWLLAAMVLCWVSGFDVIYALQDVAVDQREGLHSMPSRLGVARAMWCARGLHLAAVAFLVAAWCSTDALGAVFGAAVGVVALLLVVEHATVHRWGTTRIAATFTTVNGAVSLAVGAAGIAGFLGWCR